jgi:hypothetical protein
MTTAETIRNAGPQYLWLQKTLSESEWAITALPQVTKTLEAAKTAVNSTREKIRTFDKRSKSQLERLQDLKHHSVKRAWYKSTGKLDEKLEEEEKEWLRQYELVQGAKAKAEEQDKEVTDAKKIYDQCVEAKAAHGKAQKDLNELLERLFAGPTPSFPKEDEYEQSLAATRQRLDDVNILVKRQTFVDNSLQRAHQCLLGALEALQSALQLNTYDMFSRGGYADWMVHSALAQARDLAARAQYLVSEVRRIEPTVPHLGDIRIEQDNLVFNVIFDNIFTDLRVRQVIQESFAKVQRATLTLQNTVLPQVRTQSQAVQTRLENCQKEVRRLEQAMWNERSRIMTEIVGSGTLGTGHEQSPSSHSEEPTAYEPPPPPVEFDTSGPDDDVPNDEAPPPYSAVAR